MRASHLLHRSKLIKLEDHKYLITTPIHVYFFKQVFQEEEDSHRYTQQEISAIGKASKLASQGSFISHCHLRIMIRNRRTNGQVFLPEKFGEYVPVTDDEGKLLGVTEEQFYREMALKIKCYGQAFYLAKEDDREDDSEESEIVLKGEEKGEKQEEFER